MRIFKQPWIYLILLFIWTILQAWCSSHNEAELRESISYNSGEIARLDNIDLFNYKQLHGEIETLNSEIMPSAKIGRK